LSPDFLTKIAMSEHGVAADNLALQRQNAQQRQRGFMLIGLGVDTQLANHSGRVGRISRQQMDSWHFASGGAAQRLAVDGDAIVGLAQACLHPAVQGGFDEADIQAAKEFGKHGFGRSLGAAKTEGMGKAQAVVASKLGDGLQGFHTGERRDDRQAENSG